MEASVTEIHGYPLRPEGFAEPLFAGCESRRAVAEHFLRASWLSRASEMEGRLAGGQAAHVRRERVELERRCGRVRVSWVSGRRCRGERWVVEVLARWREVREWWDEGAGVDRTVVRVLLSDGAVVDLGREEAGEWFLVGVVD